MPPSVSSRLNPQPLAEVFGSRLEWSAPLARLTAARLGGRADALLTVNSSGELAEAVTLLWQQEAPFLILGGGSNVLVSDAGVRGVVLLNRARQIRFFDGSEAEPPGVWGESGANLGLMARLAAQRGFSGLEWAAGIPGTLGGAVFGNAGAHGSDMAANLRLAEILHHIESGRPLREEWLPEKMEYAYRSSSLKKQAGAPAGEKALSPQAVVLAASLNLQRSTPEAARAALDANAEYRRRTQPPGASMGSMFKNPPGDYAGRLIEAAGLKGARLGGAEISRVHANFFVNLGDATASDVHALIRLAQRRVAAEFGVDLELEIELVGEWEQNDTVGPD